MPAEPVRILVTGATGFVGGALLRALRERPDVEVRGIGRRPMPDADLASIDLTRPVSATFATEFRPDVIVHAAARASQWGSRAQFRAQNVDATANVLDLARRSGLPRVVYVSSTSVFYRPADQYDISESTPIGPDFSTPSVRPRFQQAPRSPCNGNFQPLSFLLAQDAS